MKKIFAILALVAFGSAFAADFVSVDVDHVRDRVTKQESNAQYVRAGKEIGGIQYGLQSRTATYRDGAGMFNSLELTAGKTVGVMGVSVQPFVGLGYDNGKNGAVGAGYQYGLVGVTTGTSVGPGYLLGGVKSRVNANNSGNPHQTVAFTTYSVPVAKQVSVNLNASRSFADIRENAYGVGLGFAF